MDANTDLLDSSNAQNVFSESVFLPVEQAFQLEVEAGPENLALKWLIAPGYYLYKDNFKFVARGGETRFSSPYFPEGVSIWDSYFERDLEVYYDQTLINLPVATISQSIELEVTSQGCADAGLCYPPNTQSFRVDFDSGLVTPIANIDDNKNISPFSSSSLAYSIVLALLGGILLNLMPCVFPVLSIKAMNVVANHGTSIQNRVHGAIYTMGVILSFIAIAAVMLLLRTGGTAVGWGFQLQSPVFVIILIYLFFIMGLALAGMFELGANLMGTGDSLVKGNSYSSSFMSGVLATTVASPCTAPFMGPALGFTLTQPPLITLVVFGCLGLGMALPFVVLTWKPSTIARLPRPGIWMHHVKQLLSFPLFMTATWLLWVVGKQTNMDVVAAVTLGLILVAMAIWLWSVELSSNLRTLKVGALLISAIALALPMKAIESSPNKPQWETFSSNKLSTLRLRNESVFVNFGADWCITCLMNERLALNSDAFYDVLSNNDITYLKGDWTNQDPEITEFLNSFNRTGVPLYLFYEKDKLKPKILSQILTPTEVLATLGHSSKLHE